MKEKMITRTVKSAKCEVLSLKISTSEAIREIIEIPGEFSDNAAALKAIKRLCETDDIKPTAVLSIEVSEQLYGMPESVFMEYAEKLPPRKLYN